MPVKSKTTKPTAARQRRTPSDHIASQVPRVSKQQQVIEMLRRPEGAAIDEIAEATGWQPHTVRGLISGLRKGKLGKREIEAVAIDTVREDGRTSYRAAPADA
jgi:hypothetical protein